MTIITTHRGRIVVEYDKEGEEANNGRLYQPKSSNGKHQ